MYKIVENYKALSQECADIMVETIRNKANASIVIATGNSPLLAYRMFVERVQKETIDLSKVTFIELDEWIGVLPECSGTCEYFIRKEILTPLQITQEAYIGFDGNTEDTQAECNRIKEKLERIGTIDLVILGIGKNGHLGLNEPAEYLTLGPHVITLDEKTKTHAMLSETHGTVNRGITLGIGNLLNTKKAILLITGSEKEEAVKEFLGERITTKIPVTLLKLHRNLICILERNLYST